MQSFSEGEEVNEETQKAPLPFYGKRMVPRSEGRAAACYMPPQRPRTEQRGNRTCYRSKRAKKSSMRMSGKAAALSISFVGRMTRVVAVVVDEMAFASQEVDKSRVEGLQILFQLRAGDARADIVNDVVEGYLENIE